MRFGTLFEERWKRVGLLDVPAPDAPKLSPSKGRKDIEPPRVPKGTLTFAQALTTSRAISQMYDRLRERMRELHAGDALERGM